MSAWLWLLLFANVQAVKTDQPLKSGCAASDKPVAQLKAGDQVEVKFALSGEARPCYLVTAKIDGKPVDGYLYADSLSGAEEFDRQR
ncbi:MAG: hypothetical protein ACRD8O_01485, partial [Bryobacteraceae bacterium]